MSLLDELLWDDAQEADDLTEEEPMPPITTDNLDEFRGCTITATRGGDGIWRYWQLDGRGWHPVEPELWGQLHQGNTIGRKQIQAGTWEG